MIRKSVRAVRTVFAGVAATVLLGAAAPPTAEYRPTFRPEALKGSPGGRANEVLVLGTPHLSAIEPAIDPNLLEPLLDRLEAWAPEAIATEDMSGLQCDSLRRFPSRYAETVETYCYDPAAAGRALGLDVPSAYAEAEKLLLSWATAPAATPVPADRRRLAALFLAAGERGSALVQWLRLAPGERRAGDGLDDDLASYLGTLETRRNETYLIAAVLAARLGLERLWAVDDHSADNPGPTDPSVAKAYEVAIRKAWDNLATHARIETDKRLQAGLRQPGGLLSMYRAYNAPETALLTFRSDFGAALDEPSPERFGRSYVGYWETRNLRMVANIRDVLTARPGTRLLAIVGASHKGYYEAYLDQMHDVRLIDSEAVLR